MRRRNFLRWHARGWRLNSDVERAVLAVYEDLALASNQTIGADRGGFEDMTRHATPSPEQPEHGACVGEYGRPPEPAPDGSKRQPRTPRRHWRKPRSACRLISPYHRPLRCRSQHSEAGV